MAFSRQEEFSKDKFLNFFFDEEIERSDGPKSPRIRAWFDREEFLNNAEIKCTQGTVPLRELGSLKVVRHRDPDTGKLLDQNIDELMSNRLTDLVSLNRNTYVIENDDGLSDFDLPPRKPKGELSPIPIAVTPEGTAICIDSNHTLTHLASNSLSLDEEIPVIVISGPIDKLIPDAVTERLRHGNSKLFPRAKPATAASAITRTRQQAIHRWKNFPEKKKNWGPGWRPAGEANSKNAGRKLG